MRHPATALSRVTLAFCALLLLLPARASADAAPDPDEAVDQITQLNRDAITAYQAKKFAEAIPGFDETIAKSAVQGDVLAETYLKRAVCRTETGDLAGAEADLAMAERGGAVGDDYETAQKRLNAKKSGR